MSYFPLLVVVMPSEQYTLELLNTTVASLDRAKSRVTGMIIGSTEIVLHDKSGLGGREREEEGVRGREGEIEDGRGERRGFYHVMFPFSLDMLNIPHAAKPSADVHVVFPHHIGNEYSFSIHVHIYIVYVCSYYIFF